MMRITDSGTPSLPSGLSYIAHPGQYDHQVDPLALECLGIVRSTINH
jgi:hypothetical protein